MLRLVVGQKKRVLKKIFTMNKNIKKWVYLAFMAIVLLARLVTDFSDMHSVVNLIYVISISTFMIVVFEAITRD